MGEGALVEMGWVCQHWCAGVPPPSTGRGLLGGVAAGAEARERIALCDEA